jgi:hypothetical protein
MMETAKIIVTWDQVGFHRWPDAPAGRDYLAARHRHLFHFRVELVVMHDDREVEFHDLLDLAKARAAEFAEADARSCEHMARVVAGWICTTFGERACAVEVWEDKENGARIERTP